MRSAQLQHVCSHAQAVLAGLERPLLCSSVHVEAGAGALELPEAAVMLDMFEPRGIDFVVDAGVTVRHCTHADGVAWPPGTPRG